MMSMHKLGAGDGYTYLTRQVAAGDVGLDGRDSLVAYYEATGNPPGRWSGSGLAGLGRDPIGRVSPGAVVTEEAMAAVFRDGHDPVTDEALGRRYAGQAGRPVVGYDLTFTVPKSASVLWALGDDATRAAVHAAHRAAVGQTLAFVEQKVARTRVGHAGCRQVRTRGVIAAAFDHWDSRAGDPNLHTHLVLANKVQGPDGLWRSLDGKTIHAAAVTVSELYDVLLADDLARRLPVGMSLRDRGARRNPAFEIDGIDEVVLAQFSSRSEQIHCAEAEWATQFEADHGREPTRVETTKARQHLTRVTRPPKVVRPLRDLLADWANRARTLTGRAPHDLAERALAGTYGRPLHAHDVGPEVRAAITAQVMRDVSTRRSVWTDWNVGSETLRASKVLRMASPQERLSLTGAIGAQVAAACVHLDDTREPDRRRIGEALYTSTELLAAEKVLIDAAETTGFPFISRHWLGDAERTTAGGSRSLADDQAAAIRAILTSQHLLDALVGPAGSGKTTTLKALTTVWQRYVGPVVALAPSATAAHALSESLGVPCETTAKWLHESTGDGARARGVAFDDVLLALHGGAGTDWDRERRRAIGLQAEQGRWAMQPGQLVIVDEASLADTRTLAALVSQARDAQAKVLLVGDHLQRGAVDAGGGFAMLARRGPTAELTSLFRFSQPWEARASLELRRAHPAALDAYERHGAFTGGSREEMLDAALDAFTAARDQGQVAVLQAADNRTVRDLNRLARSHGVRSGTVDREGIELHDGLTAGIGDRVVTRRNDRHLRTADGFVRNGALWDVVAIERDGALRVRPAGEPGRRGANGAGVRLPSAYVADHVELGYATTTARSQGMTVDQSHTIAAPGMAREDLYVAMSRGRHLNHSYVVTDAPGDDCLPGEPQPASSTRHVLDRILATSHAELSATEAWAAYHPDAPAPVRPLHQPHHFGPVDPQALDRSHSPQFLRSSSPPPPTPVRDGPVLGR